MKWLIWVLVHYNSFPGEFCIKSCCMFVDMANSYLYIFTHVYWWTYIYYVPTKYLLYICYIKLQHSYHLCSFCCFSEMLFIIKILIIDMLGIYHGYSDMAWWMSFLPLWWGILFMWSKYHLVQYIYFCISPKHFFNIIYFCGHG